MNIDRAAAHSPPLTSILLFSAAGLAYEVLLMRLFSIVHWHHFAYMMVSVALLGFAASGTFVALARRPLLARFRWSFLGNGYAFAIAMPVCFLTAQRIPFNTLEVLWDPAQWYWLSLVYVLLAIPFFFLANLITLSLSNYPGRNGSVYGADLAGAGLGASLVLLALYVIDPIATLQVIVSVAFCAFAAGAISMHARISTSLAFALAGTVIVWLFPSITVEMTPYKGLPQTLLMPGTTVVDERSSPMGLISVVESREVPFRHAPGMSLSRSASVPDQLGVFGDGDAFSVVTRFSGDAGEFVYLDSLTSALPLHLIQAPRVLEAQRVLIVGADGDAIVQAVEGGAGYVDVVEINRDRVRLLTQNQADYFGWHRLRGSVDMHVAEVRAWLARSEHDYDLITFPLVESASASGAGVHGLMEDYLFTREAWSLYFERLTDVGMIAVTRWVKLPPRDLPKLVGTAVDVLAAAGVADPSRHIGVIRGWKTTTMVLARRPLDSTQVDTIRTFAADRSFDLVHFPGIEPAEANRHHILDQPYYADATRALLSGDRARFVDDYPFAIAPATDDRPYFFQFFKWSSLETALELRGVGGLSYLEWGYPILVLTLIQAGGVGLLLVICPLLARARYRRALVANGRWTVSYFALLGFAFMFVEMAFIQKLTLFLNHPIHAAAAVLCGFLVFAGLGSLSAQFLAPRWGPRRLIRRASIAVALLAAGSIIAVPWLIELGLGWPLVAKIGITVCIIAPIAVVMGIPFPVGLELVSQREPVALPWAWSINGAASVAAAVGATLGAVHWGFTSVVLAAAIGYVSVAIIAGRDG